jgi:hypothetical protein
MVIGDVVAAIHDDDIHTNQSAISNFEFSVDLFLERICAFREIKIA